MHVGGGHEANLGDGLAGQRLAHDEVGAGANDAELDALELQAQCIAVLEEGHMRHLQEHAVQPRRLVQAVALVSPTLANPASDLLCLPAAPKRSPGSIAASMHARSVVAQRKVGNKRVGWRRGAAGL